MGAVDDYELSSVIVVIEQLATHRLEAVTEFVRLEIVEGPPEGCPVGDILWLDVAKGVPERVIAAYTAFEGVEGVALELPKHECSCSFGRDRLNL